ncbi:MAG: hypothetical protein JNM43_16355 [Planctomycetaceae bacterium]|nr:hypothetical protein [Planctomycetaceae bacterium]
MKGTVFQINKQRGMVGTETDNGFTIIELLNDDDIETGDEMEWNPETGLGQQVYTNKSKRKQMSVFAQNHWVPKQQLRSQLLID